MNEEEMNWKKKRSLDSTDTPGAFRGDAEGLERVRAALNHDLRTPLTIIVSYAQTLAQGKVGELNERQKEMLEVIIKECFRMDALIRELVDLLREALEDD